MASLLALIGLLMVFVAGCGLTVTGKVTDKLFGSAVKNATVTYNNKTTKVLSDGVFSLGGIKKGSSISIKAPGYETSNVKVDNEKTSVALIKTPEQTVKDAVNCLAYQQYDLHYQYLHPDCQKLISKDAYVAYRTQQDTTVSLTIKSVVVATDQIRMLPSWTDSTGTKKTYTNVAEVPMTIFYTAPLTGDSTMKQAGHLAKADDGTWRLFWTKT